MSNKLVVGFAFQFLGDGSTDTVTATLATGPISFFPVGGSAGVPSTLAGITSAVPSGIANISCGGLTVQGTSLLLGILTVTFTAAPTNGSIYTVSGTLEF